MPKNVYDCWIEGALIVHLNGWKVNGMPTNDSIFFQEVDCPRLFMRLTAKLFDA